MKKVTTKMIKITSRGIVSTSRGKIRTPITYPYRESVDKIWSMLTVDRATVYEQLLDKTFVQLTIQNFDQDNNLPKTAKEISKTINTNTAPMQSLVNSLNGANGSVQNWKRNKKRNKNKNKNKNQQQQQQDQQQRQQNPTQQNTSNPDTMEPTTNVTPKPETVEPEENKLGSNEWQEAPTNLVESEYQFKPGSQEIIDPSETFTGPELVPITEADNFTPVE